MALKISAREAGEVAVLDLNGRLVLGDESSALRAWVKELVAGGHKKILLNLAGVTHMDSTGVGILASSYTSASAQGGALKVTNVTERIRQTLLLTRLLTVFTPYESEAEALASFQ